MQRRGFLQLGLLGGVLLAAGGASLRLFAPAQRQAPRRALLRLDADQFSVLAAVAARVVPAAGSDGPGVPDAVEVAHRVDLALSRLPAESARDIGLLLGLLDSAAAGLLLDGRTRRFTALDGPGQDAALAAFRDSSLILRRTGYGAIRKLCSAAYYADPAAWPGVGYPGPPGLHVDDDGAAFTGRVPSPTPVVPVPAAASTAMGKGS